ncbi:MAG: Rne/Rng family ribonuclease [Bacteroidia bacterium]|nr:Rne/Rng family ribonuclease [Bacteroidia bacterium]MCO5253149.1 Rne/Rng family ribonuclease [Bacteroidota bacterium]MCZ2128760.1 Rne/Rng family ribonuclease [Bacteroidia bacterium]
MVNELFIERVAGQTKIALLSDKKLVEYHNESGNESFKIGDIYLGKVKRVVPGINAAFIDIGDSRDAFLHLHDLGVHFLTYNKYTQAAHEGGVKSTKLDKIEFQPETIKNAPIGNYVKKGQILMVQVLKEPIHNKGARVGCDISFAGRYLVLMPFSQQLSVSRKIGNPDKKREIKNLFRDFRPQNFGIIVRTVAEDATIDEIKNDLNEQLGKWKDIIKGIAKASPRTRLLSEGAKIEVILRDLLNDSFENIWVNEMPLMDEIRQIVNRISHGKSNLVKLYKGKASLFENFDIDRQIKTSFGKQVPFSAGSYLIIEHTEALHVVDVNSGRQLNAGESQQEISLRVNLEAAQEIARQLRLRDMGGIIVIDFIDLKSPVHKKQLNDKLAECMKADKARHSILPMSKFGLIQITRERLRPETVIVTAEVCPACNGSGKVESANLLEDRIEEALAYLYMNQNMQKLTLVCNPILKAYFTNGFLSIRTKWFLKYGKWLKIKEDKQISLGVFMFENQAGEEIVL